MSNGQAFRRWFFSSGAREKGDLSPDMQEFLTKQPMVLGAEAEQDLVVATAEEILLGATLPGWIGVETRYLILADVPEAALLRLPAVLGLHKPDQRMHVTRDAQVVKRVVISFARDQAWEAILDAYVLLDRLVVVLGDFRIPELPQNKIPGLKNVAANALPDFIIDSSGSFLHWEAIDLHLGASQLLQAVDPMFLADVEIERYATSKISTALLMIREAADLRQSDIEGLSERQVRRLEKEESRLTTDAARRYASALGCSLADFLERLSREIRALRDSEDHMSDEALETAPTTDNNAVRASAH